MFVEGGLHPEQVKALRKMSLQQRLELSLGAIEAMRGLRGAVLRAEHPDWSEQEIAEALRDFILNAHR